MNRIDQRISLSDDGIDMLKHFEGAVKQGERHVPYKDVAGVWTIGYGHAIKTQSGQNYIGLTLTPDLRAQWGAGIDEVTAQHLLRSDVAEKTGQLASRQIGGTQNQYDAIISFAYNLGAQTFFNSTLYKLHKDGSPLEPHVFNAVRVRELYENVKARRSPVDISGAFCAYSYARKKFYIGLFKRRLVEAMVYHGAKAVDAIERADRMVGNLR